MVKAKKLFIACLMCILAITGICLVACDDNNVDPTEHEHTYGNWNEEIAATCTKSGKEVRYCTVEGCTYYQESDTDPLGHDFGNESDWVIVDATCETKGSITKACKHSGCDNEEVKDIEALGHDYGEESEWTIVAATCSADGSITKICKRCNDEDITTLDLDPEAHDFSDQSIWEILVQPTCVKSGYGHRVCKLNNSHTEEYEWQDPEAHDIKWKSITVATCLKGEEQEGTCKYCQEDFERVTDPDLENHIYEVDTTKEIDRNGHTLVPVCGHEDLEDKKVMHTYTSYYLNPHYDPFVASLDFPCFRDTDITCPDCGYMEQSKNNDRNTFKEDRKELQEITEEERLNGKSTHGMCNTIRYITASSELVIIPAVTFGFTSGGADDPDANCRVSGIGADSRLFSGAAPSIVKDLVIPWTVRLIGKNAFGAADSGEPLEHIWIESTEEAARNIRIASGNGLIADYDDSPVEGSFKSELMYYFSPTPAANHWRWVADENGALTVPALWDVE